MANSSIWPLVWGDGSAESCRTCRLCSYSEYINPQHDADCVSKAQETIKQAKRAAEHMPEGERKQRALENIRVMEERIIEYQRNYKFISRG